MNCENNRKEMMWYPGLGEFKIHTCTLTLFKFKSARLQDIFTSTWHNNTSGDSLHCFNKLQAK